MSKIFPAIDYKKKKRRIGFSRTLVKGWKTQKKKNRKREGWEVEREIEVEVEVERKMEE